MEGIETKLDEDKILRFISRAEELIDSDFKLGKRFLYRANSLYEKGYNSKIEHRINEVVLKYMSKCF